MACESLETEQGRDHAEDRGGAEGRRDRGLGLEKRGGVKGRRSPALGAGTKSLPLAC